MASHRVHRRHTLDEINEEIERRRAADNEADREYTTPERLAALRGEPEPSPPVVEGAGSLEAWARASPPGGSARRKAEPRPAVDFDAEVEERIREEIDDFEREGSCAARGAGARGEARAGGRRAPERGVAEPGSAAERVPSGRPEEHAAARVTRGRKPQPVRRLDYRAAAPDAFAAMSRLEGYVRRCGLERPLLDLVEVRASQLNGCAYCVDMLRRRARRAGEAQQRLDALARWRDARVFTQRERSALAWTEAVTRLGPDRVSDRTFRKAREQFSDAELVNLTMAIVAIDGWNRLAIAFRAERGPHRAGAGPATPGG